MFLYNNHIFSLILRGTTEKLHAMGFMFNQLKHLQSIDHTVYFVANAEDPSIYSDGNNIVAFE